LAYSQIPKAIMDKIDTVYIDPPYSKSGKPNDDYISYYHYLEGLVQYDIWESLMDFESLHRKFKGHVSQHYTLQNPTDMFNKIIHDFADKNLVISYRCDGIPTIDYLVNELKKVKTNVVVREIDYKYALAKKKVKECIIVAY
jgi:adenine-specific DNA methylase